MIRFDVNKVGGASIKDASSVKVLSRHVSVYMMKQPTILVVSAMDKATNLLERLALCLSTKNINEARELWQEIYDFHLRIIAKLFPSSDYCPVYNEICKILAFNFGEYYGMPHDFICGKVVPAGELMSSVIISKYFKRTGLKNRLIDARDYMVTTQNHINAQVLFGETEQGMKSIFTGSLLQENPLIITQGFIGKSDIGVSSTIGREGSDYTAALLAIMLGAEHLNFWKKRGVYGNPERISREEFQKIEEDSTKGNRLLYSKCLDLLIEYGRNFRIINFDNPDEKTKVIY
jgi:aspartate kinase